MVVRIRSGSADAAGAEALIGAGQARAGMVVKLRASLDAVSAGVGEVVIFDARRSFVPEAGRLTRIVRTEHEAAGSAARATTHARG